MESILSALNWQVVDGEDSLSPAVEFRELIFSPGLSLVVVVLQVTDGSVWIVSFLDVALVALVDVVVEGIFEGKSVELVGALHLDSECTDDGLVCSPRVRDKSGSIEQSWPDHISLEIFLNSSLFEFPPNNFKIRISVISNFNLMQSIAAPIIALGDIAAVEIEIGVVMITKVIGWVDVAASHKQKISI